MVVLILKYAGLMFFVCGLFLSYFAISQTTVNSDFFKNIYFWIPDSLLIVREDLAFVCSILCLAIAYLSAIISSSLVQSYDSISDGNLVIKKISDVRGKRDASFKLSSTEIKITTLINERVNNLSEKINMARHDLFNLMLDINGIHSADDAQKSLDSLEKSVSIIKDIKKLTGNEKQKSE